MVDLGWLEGKVVVVTGAAGGLGLQLARLFASNGARVVLAGIDADKVQEASAALNKAGGTTLALHLDVTEARVGTLLPPKPAKRSARLIFSATMRGSSALTASPSESPPTHCARCSIPM